MRWIGRHGTARPADPQLETQSNVTGRRNRLKTWCTSELVNCLFEGCTGLGGKLKGWRFAYHPAPASMATVPAVVRPLSPVSRRTLLITTASGGNVIGVQCNRATGSNGAP